MRRFERSHNLTVNGVAGSSFVRALKNAVSAANTSVLAAGTGGSASVIRKQTTKTDPTDNPTVGRSGTAAPSTWVSAPCARG